MCFGVCGGMPGLCPHSAGHTVLERTEPVLDTAQVTLPVNLTSGDLAAKGWAWLLSKRRGGQLRVLHVVFVSSVKTAQWAQSKLSVLHSSPLWF